VVDSIAGFITGSIAGEVAPAIANSVVDSIAGSLMLHDISVSASALHSVRQHVCWKEVLHAINLYPM
jgi:hypothetical protein